ncbi:MAG: hypothetical protein L0Y62_04395, partial [Nitrospirae bacterium]|nr:hypothetical protein [Nitrospirota bacterium]
AALGNNLSAVFQASDGENADGRSGLLLDRAIQVEKGKSFISAMLKNKAGARFRIEYISTALLDEFEKIFGFAIIFRDVTDIIKDAEAIWSNH